MFRKSHKAHFLSEGGCQTLREIEHPFSNPFAPLTFMKGRRKYEFN